MTAAAHTLAGAAPRAVRTLHDRATWWLAAILLATLLGFQRTVQTRLGSLDVMHLLHGTASLAWLVLLIVQAELIRRRHRSGHRQLAVIGVICAMLVSATALPMLQQTAAKGAADPTGGSVPLFLAVMSSGLLLVYLGAFATAIANVRRSTVHARAMAATAVVSLPAGLGRWAMRLFHVNPIDGSYIAFAVGAVLLVALIISDRRAGVRDRVYPAMLGAMLLVAVGSGPVSQRFTHPPAAVVAP